MSAGLGKRGRAVARSVAVVFFIVFRLKINKKFQQSNYLYPVGILRGFDG